MKILLAVDGSEYSRMAVEETAQCPWPPSSVVLIVSVAEILSLTISEEWERIFKERAASGLAQARKHFDETAESDVEVTTGLLTGDPKEVLVDEANAWGADLLIVGTHGYNAFERLWLGSVSRALASHAVCSVRIVRRRNDSPEKGAAMKVLLAVDGSDGANLAVEETANRPWPKGTEVCVLCAAHLPFTPIPEMGILPGSSYSLQENAGRERAETVINTALARLEASNETRQAPLALTGKPLVGHAEESIIEIAKSWNADLVILGSHGHRGIRRFLLGSVSQAVASHAPCSVEIVRAPVKKEG